MQQNKTKRENRTKRRKQQGRISAIVKADPPLFRQRSLEPEIYAGINYFSGRKNRTKRRIEQEPISSAVNADLPLFRHSGSAPEIYAGINYFSVRKNRTKRRIEQERIGSTCNADPPLFRLCPIIRPQKAVRKLWLADLELSSLYASRGKQNIRIQAGISSRKFVASGASAAFRYGNLIV